MSRAARWLGLAAAPTFGLMALATALRGPDAAALVCSAMPAGSPLDGMTLMYALMSAFHLGPWLRLSHERRLSSH